MAEKTINRLKAVLAEKGKTNKWLAENMNKNVSTISTWCTNRRQPSLEALVEIADTLNVDVKELIVSTINQR
ncbi:Helix-turn-helix [Reichenbachiella faecimaris]|uniref:Helix-turn-helix n=1 Tax=Reichenbachiella faecimaris TaxID=692418 RepID=A0A1W2GLZ2_REIFA|nr:helix-turn-helix transcriptional regulator [Reichenbachiella faecimaris]SMD37667.1 Helix-turn-helix [Reichenbachiella faecimaris]